MRNKSSVVLATLLLLSMFLFLSACQQHEHAFGEWVVTTAATCTAEGVEAHTCSCGETENRSINATGHSWKDATCTIPKTCSICKSTDGNTAEHNFVNDICSSCGKKSYELCQIGKNTKHLLV